MKQMSQLRKTWGGTSWFCFSRANGLKNIIYGPAKVTLKFQMTRNSKAFEVWVVCFRGLTSYHSFGDASRT